MNIVVVESPAKAKTINGYLGRGYEVLASFGHVRDLPAKDGSVDPEANFHMLWEIDPKSQQRLNNIATAVKGADKLILATDPDREGEAISWHVLEALKQKHAIKDQQIERVVFNAITKQAVTEAMKHPRHIDQALVDAYLARRALDYLVGFTLSPVLWRKLPGSRSAGRVQSVALRLVCDRELEIEKFVTREYWSLVATLATPRAETFEARLVGADGKKIQRLDIGSGAEAEAFKKALETAAFTVSNVEAKPAKRNPYPPFTTSTLQQEASRKLGFAPAHTMRVAQRLYEGIDIGGDTVGLITYMRTDGVQMAEEAIVDIRKLIGSEYGKPYVPDAPRRYQTKAKNAQEAHEAIRPTDPSRRPRDMRSKLDADQAKLYELIWQRAVASQMESAELERTTVDVAAKVAARLLDLRATGSVIKFDGFLKLYQEGRDDDPEDEESRRLPAMSTGEKLTKKEISALEVATRRTIQARLREGRTSDRARNEQAYKASEIRHKRIAKLANKLADELRADEVNGGQWCLRAKNDRFRGRFHPISNVLRKPLDRYEQLTPTLRVLHSLALEPESETPALRPVKRGRPQNPNTQGWDALTHAISSLFHRRGKSPTANYRQRRYTSPFLRGFLKLHDALPADVRAEPADVLGSHIHNWIKNDNKKRHAWQAGKNQSAGSIST
jgi:DNA topoisomerase I